MIVLDHAVLCPVLEGVLVDAGYGYPAAAVGQGLQVLRSSGREAVDVDRLQFAESQFHLFEVGLFCQRDSDSNDRFLLGGFVLDRLV